jgi:hypothetical protein
MISKKEFSPLLFVSLALYFTSSVCLYSTGHWIGGTVLLGAWIRIAIITGI